jgi:CheY-like chemotaxis protein
MYPLGGERMNEVTSAKPKILIVDDVAENLHTMMNILRDD